ncbi:MAG: methyltransferase domain-containing protein [Candidatus ainarchaeum sp.]|nr:methyltransferase domain-containing protein [Candidatus ainarchaeum sp.]MDD3975604.1 methyltransferase domain-containing protein [Candidatus ainarchaeum sp.]
MKLNFGCGKDIKKGWVNVDFQKAKNIDNSFDFSKYPYPFKDDTFSYVLIDNVLEHLNNPQKVMQEIWRISKNKGVVEIIVPYYNSYYAYADPTHVNFFNEKSMLQTLGFVNYNHIIQKEKFEIIELISVPQRFIKWLPKVILNALKRVFGNIIVELRVKAKVIK